METDIYPINLTIAVIMKNKLLLEPLSRLLICTPHLDFDYSRTKKIPFFGKDHSIVGNKSHSWESTGVRCQGVETKSMKNCVSIDYQYKRNYNIKIYSENLHIVGINSLKTVDKLIDGLLNILRGINEVWEPFFKLSIHLRKKFVTKYVFPLAFDDDGIRDDYKEDLQEIIERKPEHKKLLKAFLSKTKFFSSKKKLKKAFLGICEMSVGKKSIFSSGSLKVKKIKILDGTYSSELNKKFIPLGKTAIMLRKRDIDATFHNQKGKSIRIVSNEGLENKIIRKTSSKIPAHQVNIFDSGYIRVNSPGNIELVMKFTKKIIVCILKILKEISYTEDETRRVVKRMKKLIRRQIQN